MKNPMLFTALWLVFLFCSCRKEDATEQLSKTGFKEFIISKGQHYATDNNAKPVDISEMRFRVRFDSSAIYQTAAAENQYDINKLYGFSDNGEMHHSFSARFGWRWSDGALRLFAYTYNNGLRDEKEIGTLAIGAVAECSIKVEAEVYVFSLNGKELTMPRQSATATAKGYQLYPYFGGDEAAPHDIHIWIEEEN